MTKLTLAVSLACGLTAGCGSLGARPPATAPPATNSISRQTGAVAAESWSPELAAALSLHGTKPTPASELGLAQAYAHIGIRDKAYGHFLTVSQSDPHEAAAWDGLARIWRDWGLPEYGLGHAYRAVWAAPGSPAVHNTLGTILQLLGRGRDARAHFLRAANLDPAAAYAYNNLCYSWLMDTNGASASPACERALVIDPGMVPARLNLVQSAILAVKILESEGHDDRR